MEKRSQSNQPSSQNQQATPNLNQSSSKKSQSQLQTNTFLINQNIRPQADGPTVRSRNQNGVKKSNSQNSQTNGSGTFNENDTFNKFYNKELRVSKDEIPIVLAELNDSAVQFIKREQYEKSLNLLQKAYGIMDVVDFNLCRRDRFHLFILFHNMALCYQKMQMLEECSQCIEQALEFIPSDQFNLQEKSISNRMRKLQMMGKLKLQYCAILSQVHRHKDALEQSKEGVRIGHQLLSDLKYLCEFYIKREEIEQSVMINYNQINSRNNNDQPEINYSSYRSQKDKSGLKSNSSRNRSFCHFLSQQDAYYTDNLNSQNNYFPLKQEKSFQNLSSFYTLNNLEESMSYLERTARKLLPILEEIKKRMIPEKTMKEKVRQLSKGKVETLDSIHEDFITENDSQDILNNNDNSKKPIADMKNILGYLNQGEWTQTLSIGSIMQLQPFTVKDLLEQGKNELELTRDSFISKVSLLAVSYFCYSTEIRFILQMKEDPTYDANIKQQESEYWHAKALELACTFLPSECPLLNHINLSYQKHFAPVKQTINEEEAITDDLRVVKPLNGIDNPKFQPIIRQVQNIQIAITPYQMTPVNQITKQFLSQMLNFNDYQEQQSTNQNVSSFKQQHMKSKSGDANANSNGIRKSAEQQKRKSNNNLKRQNQSEDQIETTEFSKQGYQKSISNEEDDMQKFEKLLEKLIKENKIDKSDLLKKLKINYMNDHSISQNNNMLEGESSQFNDILLDDQIMNEDDSQDHDDVEQIASEAQHQSSNHNNLYKFRAQKDVLNERPKTSNGNNRQAHHSIGGEHGIDEKAIMVSSNEARSRVNDENKKRNLRPLSGGLQKIKNDNQRSRISKMNQNLSMYEKMAVNNGSPEKNFYNGGLGQKPINNFNSFSINSQSQTNYKNINPTQQKQGSQITGQKLLNGSQDPQKPKTTDQNLQAYEELKKRLLNEYKKLTSNKKTFDEQVKEKYKTLKQRAVSGKKNNSNMHSVVTQVQQQPSTSSNNTQFSNDGNSLAKELDILDQISKKYRPSTKIQQSSSTQQAQPPVTSQPQQQIPGQNRQSSIGAVPANNSFHERQGSSYANQQMMNNQQLLGYLMNQEKKGHTNSGTNPKKSSKSHASQDLSMVKQFLNEKSINNSGVLKQNNKGIGYPNQSRDVLTQNNQYQYQTQQQFNVNSSKMISQMDQQKRTGSSSGQKKQIENANISSIGTNATKQPTFEKLKKKLNYP